MSLWNGTIVFHSGMPASAASISGVRTLDRTWVLAEEVSDAGGDVGVDVAVELMRVERGQASPIATPATFVRDGGQIGIREFMRVSHSVGIGTCMGAEAEVVGCARR